MSGTIAFLFLLAAAPAWAVGESAFGIVDCAIGGLKESGEFVTFTCNSPETQAFDLLASGTDSVVVQRLRTADKTGWPVHLALVDESFVIGAILFSVEEQLESCKQIGISKEECPKSPEEMEHYLQVEPCRTQGLPDKDCLSPNNN